MSPSRCPKLTASMIVLLVCSAISSVVSSAQENNYDAPGPTLTGAASADLAVSLMRSKRDDDSRSAGKFLDRKLVVKKDKQKQAIHIEDTYSVNGLIDDDEEPSADGESSGDSAAIRRGRTSSPKATAVCRNGVDHSGERITKGRSINKAGVSTSRGKADAAKITKHRKGARGLKDDSRDKNFRPKTAAGIRTGRNSQVSGKNSPQPSHSPAKKSKQSRQLQSSSLIQQRDEHQKRKSNPGMLKAGKAINPTTAAVLARSNLMIPEKSVQLSGKSPVADKQDANTEIIDLIVDELARHGRNKGRGFNTPTTTADSSSSNSRQRKPSSLSVLIPIQLPKKQPVNEKHHAGRDVQSTSRNKQTRQGRALLPIAGDINKRDTILGNQTKLPKSLTSKPSANSQGVTTRMLFRG